MQKLRDIFVKSMVNISKTMAYIWKNYGIYWFKTINNFMSCIRQNYGI